MLRHLGRYPQFATLAGELNIYPKGWSVYHHHCAMLCPHHCTGSVLLRWQPVRALTFLCDDVAALQRPGSLKSLKVRSNTFAVKDQSGTTAANQIGPEYPDWKLLLAFRNKSLKDDAFIKTLQFQERGDQRIYPLLDAGCRFADYDHQGLVALLGGGNRAPPSMAQIMQVVASVDLCARMEDARARVQAAVAQGTARQIAMKIAAAVPAPAPPATSLRKASRGSTSPLNEVARAIAWKPDHLLVGVQNLFHKEEYLRAITFNTVPDPAFKTLVLEARALAAKPKAAPLGTPLVLQALCHFIEMDLIVAVDSTGDDAAEYVMPFFYRSKQQEAEGEAVELAAGAVVLAMAADGTYEWIGVRARPEGMIKLGGYFE